MKKLTFLLLPLILFAFTSSDGKQEQAPEQYTAKFETTKGEFVIEVNRQWSPHAADRFYQLISSGYFNNTAFYRVVPNFVVQFGNTDTLALKKWEQLKFPDEPVVMGNKRGTLSFARGGKESRAADLFINLADNNRLDTVQYEGVKGFPAFGRIVKGMETVEQLYGGYGDTTMDDTNLYANPALFRKSFPKLDSIRRTYLIDK
jgi:peptidyl-prolyl cis-trans isomerase A (cyclophilin A)